MSKKILFIQLNGALAAALQTKDDPVALNFSFLPFAISGLSNISAEQDYELALVTEPGNTISTETILSLLGSENIRFSNIIMIQNNTGKEPFHQYIFGDYDLAGSYLIAGQTGLIQLAAVIGCTSIIITQQEHTSAAHTVQSWKEIAALLKNTPRKVSATRKTSETEISITLNLDGSGKGNIITGVGFFDHMLQQLSRHGNLDLDIAVKGDLHIDEHHTIEDTALLLGETFQKALGSKKGIDRYGFLLPMDDCLAQVVIDFGGRPWLEWDVQFKREKIGDMPAEMFFHFFKSFSDQAKCNLNIKAEVENEHHKIESIFKAFAKAIKMAVAKTGTQGIPSTKGIL